MRKPFIAGNWKMNKNAEEALSLANLLKNKLKNVKNRDVVVCPPYTSLCCVSKELKGSNIKVGAQNMHYEDKGAYTGEISPLMLRDFCEYVILGHSERRQYFNEDDAIINRKVKKALEYDLKPILCVGETLQQREENKTFDVVREQLNMSLKSIGKGIKNVIIAYEPVWAIGTGKNATPAEAEEVHIFIRKELGKLYSSKVAHGMRIIYGGSVKASNAKELMSQSNIDGCLVGGASLDADEFAKIIGF
jgi:triosephosphate isomerase